jgi:hypothetical protein
MTDTQMIPDAPISLAVLRRDIKKLTERCRRQAVVVDIARETLPQLRVHCRIRMRDALSAVAALGPEPEEWP